MKKVLLFFLISISFSTLKTSAQDVNLSTGTPIINQALVTLKEGGLSAPVSISYDPTGIVVDRPATNVGLNWTLNSGPIITRQVRGKPDESYGVSPGGAYRFFGAYTEPEEIPFATLNFNWSMFQDHEPDIYTLQLGGKAIQFYIKRYNPVSQGLPATFKAILVDDNVDVKIEILRNNAVDYINKHPTGVGLNFASYDKGASKPTIDKDYFFFALDMINVNQGGMYFKATVEDGTEYTFGTYAYERSYMFTFNSFNSMNGMVPSYDPVYSPASISSVLAQGMVAPLSWHISKITSPRLSTAPGDVLIETPYHEIKYKYKTTKYIPLSLMYDNVDWKVFSSCSDIPKAKITPFNDRPIILDPIPTEIESDLFKIKFNTNLTQPTNIATIIPEFKAGSFSDKVRNDITYFSTLLPSNLTLALNRSDVRSVNNFLKNIPDDEIIKNVIIEDKLTGEKTGVYLEYDYYKSFGISGDNAEIIQVYENDRLRLKGVYPIKMVGTSTELEPGVTFNYKGNIIPYSTVMARDKWGFYNGQHYNEKIGHFLDIPTDATRNTGSRAPSCSGQANVQPDFNSTQMGILQQITLPTGGRVCYEYELNDCSNYYTAIKINSGGATEKTGIPKIGGLRVKGITTLDPVTGQKFIKKYTYKLDNEESSGMISYYPTDVVLSPYRFNRDGRSYAGANIEYISPFTNHFARNYFNGNYITYKQVKEEKIKISSTGTEENNGYNIFTFKWDELSPAVTHNFVYDNPETITYPYDGPCINRYYYLYNPFGIYDGMLPKYDFTKGSLEKHSIFDKSNKKIEEKIFSYNITNSYLNAASVTNIYNHKIDNVPLLGRTATTMLEYGAYLGGAVGNIASVLSQFSRAASSTEDNSEYIVVGTKFTKGRSQIIRTIENRYDRTLSSSNSMTFTTEMFYDSPNHRLPTKVLVSQSLAGSTTPLETTETSYIYNKDLLTPTMTESSIVQAEGKGLLALKKKDVLSPVQVVTKRNGYVVSASYANFYGSNSNESIKQLAMSKESYKLEISEPISDFVNVSMSADGTISKDTRLKKITETTAYSEKGLMASLSSPYGANTSAINYEFDPTVMGGFAPKSKTTGVGTSLFSENYEYQPLRGLTKITGANNSFLTTSYDDFGRVKNIKDLDGNFIKSYQYNTVNPKELGDVTVQYKLEGTTATIPTFRLIADIIPDGRIDLPDDILKLRIGLTTTDAKVKSVFVVNKGNFAGEFGTISNGSSAGTKNWFTSMGGFKQYGFSETITAEAFFYDDIEGKGNLIVKKLITFRVDKPQRLYLTVSDCQQGTTTIERDDKTTITEKYLDNPCLEVILKPGFDTMTKPYEAKIGPR